MEPFSFLTEWCFQAVTERMTLTRLELWHRFQSATDEQIADDIMPANSAYDREDVAHALSLIRTANAGDLGEFALFALGLGSVPLRPSELTDERRDILIKLEVIALRTPKDNPSVKALAQTAQPVPPASLKELATKYNVSLEHIEQLSQKEFETSPAGCAVQSKLPDLVMHSRDHNAEYENDRRMAQVCRLLSMSE
ncbi:hypothetical protein [Halomonas sp. KO116]|uniref:hypothetical protein n=1 Tax=Halomonas sp. KO116 TaxID=1504981 RepID=UPI0004E3A2EB|nr:hypothetical protein [Halomonas sp. KO116]AJY53263.1 hypothetical protein KO116_P200156 [Halomonas sp. KO116]